MTRSARVAQPADQVPGGVPGLGIEAGRRLIEEHQLGAADHRGGERQPLLLAARQPPERGAGAAGEAEPLDQQPGGDRVGVEAGHYPQVLPGPGSGRDAAGLEHHADLRPQLLAVPDRVEAQHPHDAFVRPPVTLADLDRGGLPRAVRAQDRGHLGALGLQGQPRHGDGAPVVLDQATDLDGRSGTHACESTGIGRCKPLSPASRQPGAGQGRRATPQYSHRESSVSAAAGSSAPHRPTWVTTGPAPS